MPFIVLPNNFETDGNYTRKEKASKFAALPDTELDFMDTGLQGWDGF